MGNAGVTPEECRFLTMKKHGKLDIFNMHFNNVGDIQLFLKNAPDINRQAFPAPKSESEGGQEALSAALKYCLGGYTENYGQFLSLAKDLETANRMKVETRKVETSFVGQRPNVPAYIAGAPKTMYRTGKAAEKSVINVYMNVTFTMKTTDEQIRNRGIIALNLINLLEARGYIVNFRLFEACMIYNEVFVCEVVLKKPGEKLNSRLCYYPLCGKGFVRVILTRIKESMPFRENWGLSYGTVLDEKYTRLVMDIRESDIYIGTPEELGVYGADIYEDAKQAIEKLGVGGLQWK